MSGKKPNNDEDSNTLEVFKQIYGTVSNAKIIEFQKSRQIFKSSEHIGIAIKSTSDLTVNSAGFICFVSDVEGNWKNVDIIMTNKREREKVGVIEIGKSNGIIVRRLEVGKDVYIYDSNGQRLNYVPKGTGIYYVYLNLRYNTANPILNAKFRNEVGLETYMERSATEFIDYVIRTSVVPSTQTTDNNDNNFNEKKQIDQSYLEPKAPKTEGTTTPNTQNNEYTPSPTYQNPTVGTISYVINNNIQTTTIGDINTNTQNTQTTNTNNNNYSSNWDDDDKYVYPVAGDEEEFVDVQLNDIDTREEPVNTNDVLASDAEVLNNLADTMSDQILALEEPDLSLIEGLVTISNANNPFANNANDFGEFEINEPGMIGLGIPAPIQPELLQENLPVENLPVENILQQHLQNLNIEVDGLDAEIANAGIVGAANPLGIFRFLRNPIPNVGLYLPNALRNKWVLLGITSSVIVGSFAFLLLTQYDSIRTKVNSLTASFINKLRPTLPNEPAQLVQLDEYNNPVGLLNTPQQVIDSYVEYLKSSDTLSFDEHLLLDPMLESVVVDTITIKEDDKASSFTYINLKESLANAYNSASHAFSKYIPDVFKNNSSLEVPPSTETDIDLLLVNDTVLSSTNIGDKVKNILNYLWGILVFLLKNAADLLLKAIESLVGLLGNGIWLLVGAAALGLKWYLDRK